MSDMRPFSRLSQFWSPLEAVPSELVIAANDLLRVRGRSC